LCCVLCRHQQVRIERQSADSCQTTIPPTRNAVDVNDDDDKVYCQEASVDEDNAIDDHELSGMIV